HRRVMQRRALLLQLDFDHLAVFTDLLAYGKLGEIEQATVQVSGRALQEGWPLRVWPLVLWPGLGG
ncbi:MAG: hypothetical protein AAB403_07375, partial [Planctomycetota bacterium]